MLEISFFSFLFYLVNYTFFVYSLISIFLFITFGFLFLFRSSLFIKYTPFAFKRFDEAPSIEKKISLLFITSPDFFVYFYHLVNWIIYLSICFISFSNVFNLSFSLRIFLYCLNYNLIRPKADFDHIVAHNVFSNRKIYRHKITAILITYVFPLFTLEMPGMWANQHVYMHHRANNSKDDLQTLMYFRRDSLNNAVWFSIGEFFNHHFRLVVWHYDRNSKQLSTVVTNFAMLYISLFLYFQYDYAFCLFHLQAYYSASIAGYFFIEFTQHALINPLKPEEVMSNTVSTLRPYLQYKDKKIVINNELFYISDILHHEHSREANMHLLDAPFNFLKSLDKYHDKAMVFDTTYITVCLCIVLGNFEKLASLWVPIGPESSKMTQKEVIDMLKDHTRPICEPKDIPWAQLPEWPTYMMI